MAVSMGLHALLFAYILAPKPAREAAPELTEITLLSPGDLESAAAGDPLPATAYDRQAAAGARIPVSADESFRRETERADVATLTDALSAADRMSARLAAMREDASVPVANASAAVAPSAIWSTPAAAGGAGGSGQALSLARGGTGESGVPLALGRRWRHLRGAGARPGGGHVEPHGGAGERARG
jgi:hypothetical protein